MYTQSNFVDYNGLIYFRCYVCDRFLQEPTTRDHIIPKAIYASDSVQHRPTLKIHRDCNNNVKSFEDMWFSKRLLIRAHENPEAMQGISDFFSNAKKGWPEGRDAPSDKKAFADFKLAKTLGKDASFDFSKELKPGYAATLKMGEASTEREIEYIKLISKGLVIRNLGFVRVDVDDVIISQYSGLKSAGKWDSYMRDLSKLFLDDVENCHMQSWGDRVTYFISPRHSMIFIEFWKQVGYFATLEVEFPTVYVKQPPDTPPSEGVE